MAMSAGTLVAVVMVSAFVGVLIVAHVAACCHSRCRCFDSGMHSSRCRCFDSSMHSSRLSQQV